MREYVEKIEKKEEQIIATQELFNQIIAEDQRIAALELFNQIIAEEQI